MTVLGGIKWGSNSAALEYLLAMQNVMGSNPIYPSKESVCYQFSGA